jgi:hypothetical protein
MRRMTVAGSLALLVTVAVAGPARADGLGDAAKRAQAKRAEKKNTEPVTVHTNDSVQSDPGEQDKSTRGTFNAPPPKAKPAAPKAMPSAPRPTPSVPKAPPSGPRSAGGQAGLPATPGDMQAPVAGQSGSGPDENVEKRNLAGRYRRELAIIDGQIDAAEAALRAEEESSRFVDGRTHESSEDAISRLDRAVKAVEEARAARRAKEEEARRQGIPRDWLE